MENLEFSLEEMRERVLGLATPQVGEVYKDTSNATLTVLSLGKHHVYASVEETVWHTPCARILYEKWVETLSAQKLVYVRGKQCA